MREWIKGPQRSLQTRILASVLLGLGFVVLGLGALVFRITDESTRYALAERLALVQTIQRAMDREILAALRFAQNLGSAPGIRDDHDLRRFLVMDDLLDAVTVIGANGDVLLAAGRHGVPQIWPSPALRRATATRVFPIPGETVGVGLAVQTESGRLLLARVNQARLLRHLVSYPDDSRYAAQGIGPAGARA